MKALLIDDHPLILSALEAVIQGLRGYLAPSDAPSPSESESK